MVGLTDRVHDICVKLLQSCVPLQFQQDARNSKLVVIRKAVAVCCACADCHMALRDRSTQVCNVANVTDTDLGAGDISVHHIDSIREDFVKQRPPGIAEGQHEKDAVPVFSSKVQSIPIERIEQVDALRAGRCHIGQKVFFHTEQSHRILLETGIQILYELLLFLWGSPAADNGVELVFDGLFQISSQPVFDDAGDDQRVGNLTVHKNDWQTGFRRTIFLRKAAELGCFRQR